VITRLVFFVLILFVLIACNEDPLFLQENGQCLEVTGEDNKYGYVVTVREGVSPASLANEYESNYGNAFNAHTFLAKGFKVNIDNSTALEKLKCDNRVIGIAQDTLPEA